MSIMYEDVDAYKKYVIYEKKLKTFFKSKHLRT